MRKIPKGIDRACFAFRLYPDDHFRISLLLYRAAGIQCGRDLFRIPEKKVRSVPPAIDRLVRHRDRPVVSPASYPGNVP